MGRKGNWFSAIKKVFSPNSKDKLPNETEKKQSKSNEKKGRGRFKHGENRSFIPLFREPSSIEKILGEVDQQLLFIGHPTHVDQPTTPQPSFSGKPASPRVTSQRAASPRTVSPKSSPPRAVHTRSEINYRPEPTLRFSGKPASPRVTSQRAASPRVVSPKSSPPRAVDHTRSEINYRPEPTLRHHHRSATIIQAAYRGYMARKSYRALRGLVRLQGVVRGQNVKRQTVNAMKQMQLLVRVQTQIQSRRIQTLENEAHERKTNKNDKGIESSLDKLTFSNLLQTDDDYWDDSLITKEEREARLQRKMEAVIKRERAMAYAYSHQLWKATPKSAQNAHAVTRSSGFPWWWNWLDRQLPPDEPTKNPDLTPTPPRPNLGPKTSPRPQYNTPTPNSSKSTVSARARPVMTPTQTPPSTTPNLVKHYRSKGNVSGSPYPLKDDDSLMSCPPFSAPNYMSPTVSAKAKVRPTSNPKDRVPDTTASETSSKRRFSFPLTQNIGSSFKWSKKGSNKDSSSTTLQAQNGLKKYKSPRSIGDMSIDSAISMPAAFGRKPFNRFV